MAQTKPKKRRRARKWTVSIKLESGQLIQREIAADDPACALGVVLDGYASEPAFTSLSVRPVSEETSLDGERAAGRAVRALMQAGFDPALCGVGIVEAYAAAVAEGR